MPLASCLYTHLHISLFRQERNAILKLKTSSQIHNLTMKGFLYHPKTQNLCSSLPLLNQYQSWVPHNLTGSSFKVIHSWPKLAYCLQPEKTDNGLVARCASWGSITELEREMEADMNRQEDEDKSTFRHKCGERRGIVELLECLETEAIMGEDVGKEPTDYNRRAQIFDISSRVFQALKELDNDHVFPQQSSDRQGLGYRACNFVSF